MSARTRSRRELDKQQRRAAANRRIGHDMAYAYFWGPTLGIVVAVAAVGAAGWYVWTRVDHGTIAGVAGAAGVVLVAAWAVWESVTGGRQARMMRAATGRARSKAMPLVGLAGVLLLVGGIVMWTQLW